MARPINIITAGLGILALIALVLKGLPTMVNQVRWGRYKPVAAEWLRAAHRGDSLALLTQATKAEMAGRVLGLARRRPDLVSIAAATLRLQSGSRIGDTVLVSFSIDHSDCRPPRRKDVVRFNIVDTRVEQRIAWMRLELCR